MSRERRCDAETKAGRLRKATEFEAAADIVEEFAKDDPELGDALVTLYVHAGVAAADVICCDALGRYATGEAHQEAVALLERVRPDGREHANALRALLGVKTKAGYSQYSASAKERTRAARHLVREARQRSD